MQFNSSNVGLLYGSRTLINVDYFKKYTTRIFATYSLAHRPQKFTNYLFGEFSINLFMVSLILAFAKFVLLVSNAFMVGKEELFLKSLKLP